MVDYIGSEAVKKYYKEKGIVLSDRMAAARICNSRFNVEEIHGSLKEIQGRTEDAELKKQIQEYIDREHSMYKKMEEAVPGDIYRLSAWYEGDNDYCEHGYYGSFELALLAARELKRENGDIIVHKIEKFHTMGRKDILAGEDSRWHMESAAGYAEYDGKGNLRCIQADIGEEEMDGQSFEEAYYYYPHPFQRGDILERAGDKKSLYIMIADVDPAVEAEREKRIASRGDYSDMGISTTSLSRKTGRIWDMDERINPCEFEYAPIKEDTEDLIEQAALEIQRLLRGKRGSLQYIYDACSRRREDYLESERISLITGIKLRPHNVL